MSEEKEYFAHQTASVDAPCRIGAGTKIWHYSHVMPEADIGAGCNLGQNVYIDRGVHIGAGCKIQNNVSVYKGVVLQESVFCGPSVVFTNVINPRAFIERKHEFKTTLIKKGATLGANSTILCGVTVGAYALVGAGAVVTRDVPDYALIYGVPTRRLGWVCRCGVTLPEPDEEGRTACRDCGEAYRLVADERLEPV